MKFPRENWGYQEIIERGFGIFFQKPKPTSRKNKIPQRSGLQEEGNMKRKKNEREKIYRERKEKEKRFVMEVKVDYIDPKRWTEEN